MFNEELFMLAIFVHCSLSIKLSQLTISLVSEIYGNTIWIIAT